MGRIFLSIVLLFALATGASGGDPKVVTLATLTDFPPYCFARDRAVFIPVEHIPPGNDSLQLQGYSWDVVRESYHAMDYVIRLLVVPWERGTHYLAGGKVDLLFPTNKTVEREKEFVFSKEYVHSIETVIYMRQDAALVWQDLDSLAGLPIGFVRGWSYGKHWEGNNSVIKESTDSILQGFEMLGRGRLMGLVGYKRPYDQALKSAGQDKLFKVVGQFDTIEEFVMGRKEAVDNRPLLQAFDEGKKKIRENGILQRIEEKWQQ